MSPTAVSLHGPSLVLAILAPVLSATPAAAQPDPDEAAIRDVRASSNSALALADLDAFLASVDDDYAATAGNGGHVRSREELADRIGALFEDSPGLYFVRTPRDIQVAESRSRAAETGHWVQMTKGPGGGVTEGIGGVYAAYWRKLGRRWVIHAEIFVTLADGGPAG